MRPQRACSSQRRCVIRYPLMTKKRHTPAVPVSWRPPKRGAPADTPQPGGAADTAAPPDLAPSNALVQARPYSYDVPQGYDPARPTPLLVVLHGYGVDGFLQVAVFGLAALVDEKGFLLAYPNGT